MLGSWIIRTPLGAYHPRLRDAWQGWVGEPIRADRELVWAFARMDLLQHVPAAVAEAADLLLRLRGSPLPAWEWDSLRFIEDALAELEAAVWEGRLDFERLARPRDLSIRRLEPKDDPFKELPTKHWIELEIVDDETGEPVPGVRVSLRLPDGRSLEKTTNADGIIHVDGQPDDVWTIVDVKEPVEVVAMAALAAERS
jgi:hypothetical protein